jgi:hypothetical protein
VGKRESDMLRAPLLKRKSESKKRRKRKENV